MFTLFKRAVAKAMRKARAANVRDATAAVKKLVAASVRPPRKKRAAAKPAKPSKPKAAVRAVAPAPRRAPALSCSASRGAAQNPDACVRGAAMHAVAGARGRSGRLSRLDRGAQRPVAPDSVLPPVRRRVPHRARLTALRQKPAPPARPDVSPPMTTAAYTSRLATFSALSWMNWRRGSTTSPISLVKISSASSI